MKLQFTYCAHSSVNRAYHPDSFRSRYIESGANFPAICEWILLRKTSSKFHTYFYVKKKAIHFVECCYLFHPYR